jgi:hypothetical protein
VLVRKDEMWKVPLVAELREAAVTYLAARTQESHRGS